MRNHDWMDAAACRDMDGDVFFPSQVGMAGQWQAERARQVCDRCPVRRECGDFKKATGATQGVWAGKSPRQARAS